MAHYIRDLRSAKWGSTINLRCKQSELPVFALGLGCSLIPGERWFWRRQLLRCSGHLRQVTCSDHGWPRSNVTCFSIATTDRQFFLETETTDRPFFLETGRRRHSSTRPISAAITGSNSKAWGRRMGPIGLFRKCDRLPRSDVCFSRHVDQPQATPRQPTIPLPFELTD